MKRVLLILSMLVGLAYAQDQPIGPKNGRLHVLGKLGVDTVLYDVNPGDTILFRAPDGTFKRYKLTSKVTGDPNYDSTTIHNWVICVWDSGTPTACVSVKPDTVIYKYPLHVIEKEGSGAQYDSVECIGCDAGSGIPPWTVTGNTGTNPLTNFLGTTDDRDLIMRSNSVPRLQLGTDGISTFANALRSNRINKINIIPGARFEYPKIQFTYDDLVSSAGPTFGTSPRAASDLGVNTSFEVDGITRTKSLVMGTNMNYLFNQYAPAGSIFLIPQSAAPFISFAVAGEYNAGHIGTNRITGDLTYFRTPTDNYTFGTGKEVFRTTRATGDFIINSPPGNNTDTSARLNVIDSSKGILIPRMSAHQRTNITSRIAVLSQTSGGSGYTPGTYVGVPLTGSTTGSGATVFLTINSGGTVTGSGLQNNGWGDYSVGDVLTAAPPGGGSGLAFVVTSLSVAANGLLVYDTDSLCVFEYAATEWISLCRGSGGGGSSTDAWKLTGNAGTDSSINFVGTTDSIDMNIRTKNTNRLIVKADGRVGIGVQPKGNFHVLETLGSESAMFENVGSTPSIIFRRSNGTLAAPTSALNGDALASVRLNAYAGSSFPLGTKPIINVNAAADWTETNQATTVTFLNTAWNGTSAGVKLALLRSGGVSINTTNDDTSAIFNVVSTNRGMLMPKLTTAQRDLIPPSASGVITSGLIIYNTTDSIFQYKRISGWTGLSTQWTSGASGTIFNNNTGNVGIGTGSTIAANLHILVKSATSGVIVEGSPGINPNIGFKRTDGTGTTATTNNASLGSIRAAGYGSTVAGSSKTIWNILAGEDWTDGSQSVYQTWATTPYGATASSEAMRLTRQKNLLLGTTADDTSAILNLTSTSKGLLTPRLNSTQMNAIPSPANGLLIYNTDSASFCYYSGGVWNNLRGPGGTGTSAVGLIDSPEHVYTPTVTFSAGTAPAGTTTHTYQWSKVGKQVTLRINLIYGTAGATVTTFTLPLPADCPAPVIPAGSVLNDYVMPVQVNVGTGQSVAPAVVARAALRNAATKAIVGTCTSGAYTVFNVITTYFTN